MTPLKERVILLSRDEVVWPFGREPYLETRHTSSRSHQITVDPFPCYTHDPGLVTQVAQLVESRFPVDAPPHYYLLPHECPSRTNGHASRDDVWVLAEEGDWRKTGWEGHVVLGGKRIPLHPAMTRYLVAHEYGHIVQYHLEARLGIKDDGLSPTKLEQEYAELRGVEPRTDYGGLRWHSNIGELFANDFRILLCNVESEFWPHPGFEHPESLPKLRDYWEALARDHAVK